MTTSTLRVDVKQGVARIELARPERGNPIDELFCREFRGAVHGLVGRDDVRVVQISAKGKFFCVGGDIKAFVEERATLPDLIRRWTADLHLGLSRLQRLDAPIVAVVQGDCAGGGLALAAGCDLVVASSKAHFTSAYSKIGYSCDAGCSIALVSRLGVAQARRFLLLNEVWNAESALKAGLADFVVDPAQLAMKAEEVTAHLARGPTRAYGAIRRLVRTASRQPTEAQLEDEANALAGVAATADAAEGIIAFCEKRAPTFSGA